MEDSVVTCLKLHIGDIPVENIDDFVHNTRWSILVFLTGEEEINRCCEMLKNQSKRLVDLGKRGLSIHPLYSALTADMQKQAVSHCSDQSTRNIIVSTNIAETSITIPGVRVVIDCGFSKQK